MNRFFAEDPACPSAKPAQVRQLGYWFLNDGKDFLRMGVEKGDRQMARIAAGAVSPTSVQVSAARQRELIVDGERKAIAGWMKALPGG